jgi:predicted XRE-type DNA-binding protein
VAVSHGTAVLARVAWLMARHHGGDQIAAATSLGIERHSLTALLSGDWRRFSLDALAALVRHHGVSVRWLLGSPPRRTGVHRPSARQSVF